MSKLKAYYQLTKPGIIYGNLLTLLAGFFLASHLHFILKPLLGSLIGSGLVIAAACVYNNFIDRGIDRHMSRTKQRALVQGSITGSAALVYASILLIAGFGVLIAFTNWQVVLVGIIGLVDYLLLYGVSKRKTALGTIVGSISGATPILAGYVASNGTFDRAALLLFLIMAFWQMPHFYAIAMYRAKDYAAAKIPVLPLQKGMYHTKLQILTYVTAFTMLCMMMTVDGYTGYSYLIIMLLLGLMWLRVGLRNYQLDDAAWGKQMFLFSLIVVSSMSIMLPLGSVLP